MKNWLIISVLYSCFSLILCHMEKEKIPKLLMISFDGFRHDYIKMAEKNNKNVSAFKEMMKNGVHAGYVNGVFASVTIPSHISIASGMYEESHGVVDNQYHDPKLNDTYKVSSVDDNLDPKWWNMGFEPIWITNERQGHQSAVINYPGFSARYKGYIQTYSNFIFEKTIPWKYWVDLMIGWLEKEHTSLGVMYHYEPDSTGHRFGPDSQQILDQIEKCNGRLQYLMDKVQASHELRHSLNIMLVSDHGMAQLSKDRVISMDTMISQDLYYSYSKLGYALWGLWPKEGKEDEIMKKLKHPHLKVWKKEEVPSEFHYSKNRRIPPIVALAADGWQLRRKSDDYYQNGTHGYNNSLSDMHPIFLATGPAFKRNFTLDSVRMVDYYSLMCKILGLTPHPNNGSLKEIQAVLGEHKDYESVTSTFVTFLICFLVAGTLTGIFCLATCLYGRTSRWRSTSKRRNQRLDAVFVSDTSRVRLVGNSASGINSTGDELFSDDDDDSI